ncbi:type II toxin-antitoxin system antitoxin DNA ADP-ribosyl glycohydrolase DarG [Hymenobacter pini]|uniref:type II toxin-antitoxin system antitoxin DNA ADP-ribosyl glycohydrolase DarG n=1 Tax=Hymenobacter pini TaxID=2880879 RepID=UPI001CF280F2|nr:macro domain-containing protein [Hymenobacter pini]MCA8831915.1 macro domain-containing protein [Hymenobacter pini]
MISSHQGNLLQAPTDALINTVNTEGVMGKGIALQFKEAFDENYRLYRQACKEQRVRVGEMFVTETHQLVGPRFIINFPTKRHWKERSRLEYITEGLKDLKRVITQYGITSVAMPPLGCGNGGLDWEVVRPLIEQAVAGIGIPVHLYEPSDIVSKRERKPTADSLKLTPARAMLLAAMRVYSSLGYSLSLVEVQKLAYFLQRLGEPLRLDFQKGQYGPYAHNLSFVLHRMDGAFLHGMQYKDAKAFTELTLIEEKFPELEAYMEHNLSPAQKQQFARLTSLIEGFESPLGMELLATVDYLLDHQEATDLNSLVAAVGTWNARKKRVLIPEYLQLALGRLREQRLKPAE